MQLFYFNLRNHDGAPQADEKCMGGGQGINFRPGHLISTVAQHSYAASDPAKAEMQLLPGGHCTPITAFYLAVFSCIVSSFWQHWLHRSVIHISTL